MPRIKKEILSNIANIKKQVLLLLSNYEKTVFEKFNDITKDVITRDVYFLNIKQFNEIYALDLEAKSISDAKEPLYDIISIRTTNDNPIWRYSEDLVMKLSSSTITDRNKIKDEIPRRLKIYQNKKRKYLKEFIQNADYLTQNEISNKEKELEIELQRLERETQILLENFHEYKVQISSYAKKEKYPYLYCNFHNGLVDSKGKQLKRKATDIPLRQDVANIFYFEERYLENDDFKLNASVKRFIKDADCLFEDVYFKKAY